MVLCMYSLFVFLFTDCLCILAILGFGGYFGVFLAVCGRFGGPYVATSCRKFLGGLFKWKLSVILGIYAVFVFLSTDCWCIFVGCLVTAGVRNSSSMVKLPLMQCIGIQ